MFLKNKKGVIGTTLTWFTAMFIIVFILLIFLSFTGILFLQKEISSGDIRVSERRSMNIYVSSENFEVQRDLFYVLNYPVEEGIFKNLIIGFKLNEEEKRENIFEKLETILEKNEDRCYLFSVDDEYVYLKEPLLDPLEGLDVHPLAYASKFLIDSELKTFGLPFFVATSKLPSGERVLERRYNTAETSLILSEDEKINVKIYSRKC